MHAGAKDSQAPLATKRVVPRQDDRCVFAQQGVDDQRGEKFPEVIDIPNGLAKEPVVIGEVPIADRIARNDQVRDVATSDRKNPACHQQTKRLKAWVGENGRESA